MTRRSAGGLRVPRSTITMPGAAYVLMALIAVLALAAPRFLTVGNLINLSRNAAILALAAYGQAIVIITGGLDLSIGSSVALVSVLSVLALGRWSAPLALAAGYLGAIGVGVANGLLVSMFDIPPFLVTLGTLTGVHGLASLLVGGIPLEAPPSAHFSWLGRGAIGPLPVPILLAALGFVALSVLLQRTVLGRRWYLVGANPQAARIAGIRVRRTLFGTYVTAATFAGAAGLVLTSRVNSGQPNLFPILPFEAIAACAIGGIALSGGMGTALQVLIGVLIVSAIENGLRLLNFSSDVQLMLIGVLTVCAVLLQTAGGRFLVTARSRAARPVRGAGTVVSAAEEIR